MLRPGDVRACLVRSEWWRWQPGYLRKWYYYCYKCFSHHQTVPRPVRILSEQIHAHRQLINISSSQLFLPSIFNCLEICINLQSRKLFSFGQIFGFSSIISCLLLIRFFVSITSEPFVRFSVSRIFGKFRSPARNSPILDYISSPGTTNWPRLEGKNSQWDRTRAVETWESCLPVCYCLRSDLISMIYCDISTSRWKLQTLMVIVINYDL